MGRRRSKRGGRLSAAVNAALVLSGAPAHGQFQPSREHDASLPIEITADTLEVRQDLNVAVFRGHVEATQGDLDLRADQLTVHYRADETGKNTIALIEAEGNVFLNSPNEQAQGDKGIYDVDAQRLELIGSAMLRRNENQIEGDHLTLNLATGESKMESRAAAAGGTERVKAVFVPKSAPRE